MGELINTWLGSIAFVVSIVNIMAVWIMRPGKIAKERHEALRTSVDERFATAAETTRQSLKEHDRRIQAIEGDCKHMPTQDDFQRLSEKVVALDASVTTELKGLSTTVHRIDSYLRESGK